MPLTLSINEGRQVAVGEILVTVRRARARQVKLTFKGPRETPILRVDAHHKAPKAEQAQPRGLPEGKYIDVQTTVRAVTKLGRQMWDARAEAQALADRLGLEVLWTFNGKTISIMPDTKQEETS